MADAALATRREYLIRSNLLAPQRDWAGAEPGLSRTVDLADLSFRPEHRSWAGEITNPYIPSMALTGSSMASVADTMLISLTTPDLAELAEVNWRLIRECVTPCQTPRPADMQRAIRQAVGEALEEGYGEPSDVAVQSALKVSSALPASVVGEDPDFSATSDEVSLHLRGRRYHSVLLIFESSGKVQCLVNRDGVHRSAIYDSDETLPDGFVREALGATHDVPAWR